MLLGGAVTWPLAARAQHLERIRRVGLLSANSASDPETQARLAALSRRLQDLGWTEGRNIQIDYRFSGGNMERTRAMAARTGGARSGRAGRLRQSGRLSFATGDPHHSDRVHPSVRSGRERLLSAT